MDRILEFGPHKNGIPKGVSCNYVSKVGNEFWISCIPKNSVMDKRLGIKYEMAVFLIDGGYLDKKKTFYYKTKPTAEQMSKDALGVCDGITEYIKSE